MPIEASSSADAAAPVVDAPPRPTTSGQTPSPEPSDPRSEALVNKARVALATGLPLQTIDTWTRTGRFPKPIKFGDHRNAPIRWRWRAVQDWIRQFEEAAR